MKKIMFLVIFIGLIVCLRQPSFGAEPSGELKIGLLTLYDQTFHPIWRTFYRKSYLEPMYDNIIGVDKEGNFDPKQSIAYKWEQAQDQLSWTFYIRDGVKFHNGDPLTNEDVKYTIEQAGSKKNIVTSPSIFTERVERVEAVPPNKVVVYLKTPWPTFLYLLSTRTYSVGYIQPKKYIEEKGEKNFLTNPVGSGPYKFYENKEGEYVKLVAQSSHWRVGTPKYKYLTFKLMPEEGTREAALRSGEVDVISIGIARMKGLQDAGFTIQKQKDGLFVDFIWLQHWRPEFPTNKLKVRQALIYAINKKDILNQILQEQGKLVSSTLAMFPWSIEYKPYPPTLYDPKLAKKLIAEAGYPNGFQMYLYSYVNVLPETKLINEAIAGYWEEIGVKTKVLEMAYAAFLPHWNNQKDPVGPAAFVAAMPNRPLYPWRDAHHSAAKYSHTKDPNLDPMIESFEREKTMQGYIASAQKISDYVLEHFYGSGICSTDALFAANKKVPLWEMGKGVNSYRWEYIGAE